MMFNKAKAKKNNRTLFCLVKNFNKVFLSFITQNAKRHTINMSVKYIAGAK